MNPAVMENKQEQKNEQVQSQPIVENKTETAPSIKSEENQANWKAFREQRESERKAREEAERRAAEKAAEAEALKAALEASLNKPQQSNSHNQDSEETEEQRIDRRVNALLAEREAQYEKTRQNREREEAPVRIMQAYPDFKQVVSVENCDYLDYHHPELTAPYKYMPEGYEKWEAMYKAIKKFVPNVNSKQEEKRVEKNLQKPGSISSTGSTQGTGAMPSARLDDAKKEANWARMQRSLKGLSN